MTTYTHKELAINCFNAVWDLLDLVRANALLGFKDLSKEHKKLSLVYVQNVKDEGAKEILLKDLQSIN
jgi:hypothetical protein